MKSQKKKKTRKEWHHITTPQHDSTILFWIIIKTPFGILLLLWDCDGTTSKDIVMLNQKRIVNPWLQAVWDPLEEIQLKWGKQGSSHSSGHTHQGKPML